MARTTTTPTRAARTAATSTSATRFSATRTSTTRSATPSADAGTTATGAVCDDSAQGPSGAAHQVVDHRQTHLRLPLIGEVRLPPADQLVFVGGLAALAALDVIEWPVAAAVGLGHALVNGSQSRQLKDFGEALEEA